MTWILLVIILSSLVLIGAAAVHFRSQKLARNVKSAIVKSAIVKPPKSPLERQRHYVATMTNPTTLLLVFPEALLNSNDPKSYEGRQAVEQHTAPIINILRENLPLGGIVEVLKPIQLTGDVYLMYIALHLECFEQEAVRLADAVVDGLTKESKNVYWVKPARHTITLRVVGEHGGRWKTERPQYTLEKLSIVDVKSAPSDSDHVQVVSATGEWKSAVEALSKLTADFAAYEFDPQAVLIERPLLRDLTEPATARFYDAFGDANALLTSTKPDTKGEVDTFVSAVERAVRAWDVANDNALRKGEQNITADSQRMSPEQVSAKNRAAGLLNKALDAAAPEAEAALSWSKALDSLTHAGMGAPKSAIDKLKNNNELVSRAMKALPA